MDDPGVLKVGVRTNVHFHYKVYDDLGFMLYEPLLRYGSRRGCEKVIPATLDDLVPRLITGWQVSPDGFEYTINLRKGIVSSHGNPFTAADVKWSWDRALLARRQGRFTARIAPLRDQNATAIVDNHIVRFTLERPNITFPHFLTSKYVHIYDSVECRKHATPEDPWAEGWLAQNSAGFGPFTVESYDTARDIATYVANPYYFHRPNPGLKKIQRIGVKSMEERVARFRNGELDAITSLSGEHFLELAAEPGTKAFKIHGHDPLLIQMNCQRGPFDRVEVRQAVSYAIPYEEIFNVVWKGLHRTMRSPFVDACAGYTEEFFPFSMDIGKARELLRQAGLAEGFETSLLVSPNFSPHMRPTADIVRDALRQIGVIVRIEEVDEKRLRSSGFAHDFDMMLDPHIHMIPDDYYISLCDYGDAKWGVENLNQYFNGEVFNLQKESLSARSEAERISYAREMQKIIVCDAPQVFLMQLNTLMITGSHVDGMAWDANGRIHYHEMTKLSPIGGR
jgi:peptide/nickel transport system substrate-binding protein